MKFLLLTFFLFSYNYSIGQNFNKQDSLRGSITPERIWWDLQKYELDITLNISEKSISGSNKIIFKALKNDKNIVQIDLQHPMHIDKVTHHNNSIDFKREGNAYFITLSTTSQKNKCDSLTIFYSGIPKETNKAPWEGGITWSKDAKGNDFIGTSCQGDGASLWWPCKDHLYDEPDEGMKISYTVPNNLIAVGNGRLVKTLENKDLTKTYTWQVKNPINNYDVQMSVGNYVHFHETYKGEAGLLDCYYYVLKQNYAKAKKQFKQVPKMLEAFEFWFGPYPFYEDSYKLVESPFLGMEHQSAVSYGNGYQNGYRGYDLSGTGWGMEFDFIIIHETGHEWFGNNITNKDIADMWIHESFTNYSESMYLEYTMGKKAANEYTIGLRKNIQNDIPIIGKYNVNNEGSGDMYYKGANMLHSIRFSNGNDADWRKLLRGLGHTFYHKTVTTEAVENYISKHLNFDFSSVFDQYLRTTQIPVLEIEKKDKGFAYRWSNCVPNFDLPMNVFIDGIQTKIKPEVGNWKKHKQKTKIQSLQVDPNFYITTHFIN